MINSWSPIRDAIKSKGGKYGELDIPLVVAINFECFHLDRLDEMQALFGQEQIVYQKGTNSKPKMRRAPNGAWYGKSGPEYTRVSAAWIFNDLHASSLAHRRHTVYYNPWAKLPAPESLKRFPSTQPLSDKIEWNEGLSLRNMFELDKGWPENT